MDSNVFWDATASAGFNFVRHNDTDFEGFKEFKEGLDERFSARERERTRELRAANLKRWDASLPERWRGARLNLIAKPVVPKLLQAFKSNPKGSFFLTGEAGSGKTFVGYALVRRLIGAGVATPTQVKILSEGVLRSWASGGFRGRESFDEVLSPKYRVYLFDGIGALTDREVQQVTPFWEQILEHIYSKDLTAIFTSSDRLEEFGKTLSHSGETKLFTLTDGRSFTVERTGSLSKRGEDRADGDDPSKRAASKDGAWKS